MLACACIVLLLATDTIVAVAGKVNKQQGKRYEFDKSELRKLWFTASLKGLLKAKARSIYTKLPVIERIVYKQCSEDSKTPGELATCVVRLMDSRDRIKREEQIFENNTPSTAVEVPVMTKVKLKKIELIHGTATIEEIIPPRVNSSQTPIAQHIFRDRTNNIFYLTDVVKQSGLKLTDANLRHVSSDAIRPQKKTIAKWKKKKRKELEELHERIIMHSYRDFSQAREKRKVDSGDNSLDMSHIGNLKKLQEHLKKVDLVNTYFQNVNQENTMLYKSLKYRIQTNSPIVRPKDDVMDEVLNAVNAFITGDVKKKEKYALLSPRILSIIPENRMNKNKKGFLSPTLFSFHKDGLLSLQDLFQLVSSERQSQRFLLELMLELSGAGGILDKLLKQMEPEVKQMSEHHFPMVQEMARVDLSIMKAHNSFTDQQSKDYKTNGYAFYEKPQIERIFGGRTDFDARNFTDFMQMNRTQKELLLEQEIRTLARIHKEEQRCATGRCRRQAEPIHFHTLQPLAFTNFVNHGASMEVLTLSPHAFIGEVLLPSALVLQTLSPEVFAGSVLSPNALVARTLSPSAFRGEILSPRALTSWVLSPEALVLEVLTPKFLDPRVLSPETLIIEVLSPNFLSPFVMSPTVLGVVVLSPAILSPRVQSPEKLIVEILSPHILGGPHSEEESEEEVMSDHETHEGHEEAGEDPQHTHLNEKVKANIGTIHKHPKKQKEESQAWLQ